LLKRVITYQNPFTDEEVTEEHWFHISKADLVEMQMESMNEPEVREPETGEKLEGFRAKLQRIINSKDGVAILEVVKDMINRSYGKRDGDRFLKSPEILAEFSATEAFSQLLFDLCTDAEAQAEFMNGIMPRNLENEAAKIAARAAAAKSQPNSPAIAAVEKLDGAVLTRSQEIDSADSENPLTLTPAEVNEMDSDQLKSGLAAGKYKLS
jgi:hypothetical protein